jgi:hypothetical protein
MLPRRFSPVRPLPFPHSLNPLFPTGLPTTPSKPLLPPQLPANYPHAKPRATNAESATNFIDCLILRSNRRNLNVKIEGFVWNSGEQKFDVG